MPLGRLEVDPAPEEIGAGLRIRDTREQFLGHFGRLREERIRLFRKGKLKRGLIEFNF